MSCSCRADRHGATASLLARSHARSDDADADSFEQPLVAPAVHPFTGTFADSEHTVAFGSKAVFRGACLRVLAVVCEGMTPQSDLWRLWKRKLTRVATHSESPRLHSLQRRHQRRQSGGRGGVGQFRRQTCPETLHSRDAERHVSHCTPIASGDGEGTWEVRRRPRARAAGERCAGGGEKGRPARN